MLCEVVTRTSRRGRDDISYRCGSVECGLVRASSTWETIAGEMSLVDALNEAARLVEKLLDAEGYQHKPFTPAK